MEGWSRSREGSTIRMDMEDTSSREGINIFVEGSSMVMEGRSGAHGANMWGQTACRAGSVH